MSSVSNAVLFIMTELASLIRAGTSFSFAYCPPTQRQAQCPHKSVSNANENRSSETSRPLASNALFFKGTP